MIEEVLQHTQRRVGFLEDEVCQRKRESAVQAADMNALLGAAAAAEPRAIDGTHPQPQSVWIHQEVGADDV